MKSRLLLALLLVFGFCYALADEERFEREKMERMEMEKGNIAAEQEMRETIEAFKIARLKEELDLTAEQAGRFFEHYYRLEDIKKEFGQKKTGLVEEINKLLSDKEVNEKELKEKVEAYERVERETQDKIKDMQNKIKEQLSMKQRAKLICFEKNFDKYVKKLIKKIIDTRQGKDEFHKRKMELEKGMKLKPGSPGEHKRELIPDRPVE